MADPAEEPGPSAQKSETLHDQVDGSTVLEIRQ